MVALAEQIRQRLHRPAVAGPLVFVLLFVGLIVDLTTEQPLVVAILYNIPIAVAGVLLSVRLTAATIVLALLANLGAGFENAHAVGETDPIAAANRVLAGVSFLLVGGMSLLFEATEAEVEELGEVEQATQREREIRHAIARLSGPVGPRELLEEAAEEIKGLLGAFAVVVTALDGERFAEPRIATPTYTSLAEPGKLAGWAVDSLPVTSTPVITVRQEDGILSVGRLRCGVDQDLIVLAARPTTRKASELLGEVLGGLEPLLERAHELQRLRDRLEGREAVGDA